MKKTVKDIVSIVILVLNILCLTLNCLMWLYGISTDYSSKAYTVFYKTNALLIVDFIELNYHIWMLGMVALFITGKCRVKKSKASFILGIINLALSPIALLIFAGSR